ncbi:MAG TPA: hypothetical protein VGF16_10700 [Bryobacteraceae bacterium]|jgi:hypothetical protein
MWSNTQAARIPTTENKLAQLRAKTDRDLGVLLRSLIERAFRALGREEYAEADAAYAQAAKLLPLANDLSGQDSEALRNQLDELRGALDKSGCPCSQ